MSGIPSQFDLLGRAIEFAQQNHQVISQNLANANTPGYQARQLSFEQFLEHADSKQKLAGDVPQFHVDFVPDSPPREDGNTVDLDTQLGNMKKNELAYQTLNQLLGTKISMMRTAIKG